MLEKAKRIFHSHRAYRIWLLAFYGFKSDFQGSYLGVVWAVAIPLVKLLIYFVVFGMLLENRQPLYVLYLYSGFIFWGLFADITLAGLSVIDTKKYLIENIGVAKIDLFVASLVKELLKFACSLGAYLPLSMLFASNISLLGLLMLPIWVGNLLLYAFACSLLLAILKGVLPDIRQLWSLVLMGAMWLTPVVIPSEAFEQHLPVYSYLNPMAGILKNMRLSLVYQRPIVLDLAMLDLALGACLCFFAYRAFRWMEKDMLELNERV